MQALKIIVGIAGLVLWMLGTRLMLLYGAIAAFYLSPLWLFALLMIGIVYLRKCTHAEKSRGGRFLSAAGFALIGTVLLFVPTLGAFTSLNDSLTEFAVSRFINQIAEQEAISDSYCYRDKDITTTIIADFTSDFEVDVVDYQFETHILLVAFENGVTYDFYVSYHGGCWHMRFSKG